MNIRHFDDLIQMARAQPLPQSLLLVFAEAQLPEDSTPEQRKRFESGEGGVLTPIMCVDKPASELASFQALATEAAHLGVKWQIIFAAAMTSVADGLDADTVVGQAFEKMVAQIKAGKIEAYVPFDQHGDTVILG